MGNDQPKSQKKDSTKITEVSRFKSRFSKKSLNLYGFLL